MNCIVVGAHHSNRACEVLISRHFNAKPFDSRPDNRQLIPFRFIRGTYKHKSALNEVSRAESTNKQVGIYSEEMGRIIARVDYRPLDDFYRTRIDRGRDAAIVLVVNKPFGTQKNVKLVVLAGFARMGTVAAAKALREDYRNLEPISPNNETVGVIEALYTKPAGGDKRRLVSYNWVFLKGGRHSVNKLGRTDIKA
jgi:hypothetical protein